MKKTLLIGALLAVAILPVSTYALTKSQVNIIVFLLQSFNASEDMINNVRVVIEGEDAKTFTASSPSVSDNSGMIRGLKVKIAEFKSIKLVLQNSPVMTIDLYNKIVGLRDIDDNSVFPVISDVFGTYPGVTLDQKIPEKASKKLIATVSEKIDLMTIELEKYQ